jgi:hypothetical protein
MPNPNGMVGDTVNQHKRYAPTCRGRMSQHERRIESMEGQGAFGWGHVRQNKSQHQQSNSEHVFFHVNGGSPATSLTQVLHKDDH